MKLEHLIKGYKTKGIDVAIEKEDKLVSVLKFTNNIYADCYRTEDVITSVQIVADTKVKEQIKHCTDLIKIISNTIDLQTNLTEIERNIILNKLGLFNGSILQGTECTMNEYFFKAYVMKGVFMVIVSEIEQTKV